MFKNVFFALGTVLLLVFVFVFFPLDRINWGKVSLLPAQTITVTGSAQGTVSNNVAVFNATVAIDNNDKQTAVNLVNTKMGELIKALKDFGIAEADIRTENVSVYQMPNQPEIMMMYPRPPQNTGNAGWRASNSVSITLRDVSKASALSDLLNKSGATGVFGPNFSSDQNLGNDADLLAKAIDNAKKKAESMAKAGGRLLGRMISVEESGSGGYPIPYGVNASESVGTPIEPGTSSSYKSVTVVFELK